MELRLNKKRCTFTSIFIGFLLLLFTYDQIAALESLNNFRKSGASFWEIAEASEVYRLLLFLFIAPMFLWVLKLNLWDGLIKKKVMFRITPDGIWNVLLKEDQMIPWSAITEVKFDEKLSFLSSVRAHVLVMTREMRKKYIKSNWFFSFDNNPKLVVGFYDRTDDRIRFEIEKHFEASRGQK